MKAKIILLMLVILPAIHFMGNGAFAQTVSGTPGNTGCLNSGTVTAGSTGLGATPQYQLLKLQSGVFVVVAPAAGDATQFTNNNVFTGLAPGTYTVKGRATGSGTIYTSTDITVTDGYTAMVVRTATRVTSCVGGTAALTSVVTGGRAPFIYKIATQAAPGTFIETSSSTNAATYTFAALTANSYIVSVTDACGVTVTGATSISNPTVSINDIKNFNINYLTYEQGVGRCDTPLRIVIEGGWIYTIGGAPVSPEDAALFTWKIKYQGVLYGLDTTRDGYADANGAGIPLANIRYRMPLVATRAGIIADYANMRIVVSDLCGRTKELLIRDYNAVSSQIVSRGNCNGSPVIQAFLGAGMACLPIDITFTNADPNMPLDRATFRVTQTNEYFMATGLMRGQTYNLTYDDGTDFTGNTIYRTTELTLSSSTTLSVNQSTPPGNQYNLDYLDYGRAHLSIVPVLPTDDITYTVTASSNPLVPVGYSVSRDDYGSNTLITLPKVNASDPDGFWPKGTYTLLVRAPCGEAPVTLNIGGYTSSLSGYTATPVCGGFNYVMNGTFDEPNAYQVVIVSGPSSVGQVRDLASGTESFPFNGLANGTYVFGLRIKGGTRNVLTQTVTYGAANAITVDPANTGGYTCRAGVPNGTLTITATSNLPAPGNTLEYALSRDGGVTYSAFQTANTFDELIDGTYYFKVKDGCGNIITQTAQIGVAADLAVIISINGTPGNATLCEADAAETMALTIDTDIPGATYLWTGNGITGANRNLKNPVVSMAAMQEGLNNYSCTLTLGPPCNITSVGDVDVTILANSTVIITNPEAVCSPNTVDITLPSVTTGSDAGLTYTYFSDAAGTVALPGPTAIAEGGTYYIKGTNTTTGCSVIRPVVVTVNPLPVATISYPNGPYCTRGTATVIREGVAGGTYASDAGVSINPTTGAIDLAASTPGSHTVTYSFSEGMCSNTTTAAITINATTMPAALADITAQCSVTPTAPTLSDPCAGEVTATTTTVFPITTQGTTVIPWIFDYGNGYTQTTTQNVIIDDTVAPVAPVLADVTGQCSVTPVAPTAEDACAGTVTGTTTTAFPVTALGTTVVTWAFDDNNGNVVTATQNVIIDDTVAPVVPILADVTGQCSATPVAPTTTDACAGTVTGTTTTAFPITTPGTTVITWTFTDTNGNIVTATQNVIIADTEAPVVPVLADVTGQCSATPVAPITTDACAGTITGTTTTAFPITAPGTTVVTWTFTDPNGNVSTATQNVIITNTTLVGPESTYCLTDGSGYTVTVVVNGQAPYTATGTGAPGTWVGNTFTSGTIPTGTNYNINIQDVNACNTLVVSGTAPVCCVFDVTCPTFPATTVTCYSELPTATTLTEAAFEALGNADGTIADTFCGVIVITATNGANPGCSGDAVRTYTITEYDDINNNNIHDADENTVLNSTTCTQLFTIQDTTAPVLTTTFDTVIPAVCDAIPAAPVLSFTDNCTDVSAITVDLTEVVSTVSPNGAYTIVRTWTASDLCGNQATASQTVNVSTPDYFRTITIDAQCNIDVNVTVDVAAIITSQFPGVIRQGGTFIDLSGAGTALTSSGIFTPLNLADGNYIVRYENNDINCPGIIEVTIPVNREPACTVANCIPITIHNAITPNGDGLNETFMIDNVTNECYRENTIEIYNRWGVKVYDATNYNNEDVVFKGYSEGRGTIKESSTLPTGTYFYVFKFKNIDGNYALKTGWLYLSGTN